MVLFKIKFICFSIHEKWEKTKRKKKARYRLKNTVNTQQKKTRNTTK